jgi:DNA invertase Pin-like site-specific DNA recombinase
MTAAFGYLRTSSAANVGADKDSEPRQRAAIQAYADANGITIKDWFYDAAVSGADAIETRPGFKAMLERINGTRTIIVETASRFARDLIIAETEYTFLREQGIALIAADSPTAFLDDGPTSVLVRQILAAVSQFEKTMLVRKLRAARDRKKAATGRCGGRVSPTPEATKKRARELRGEGLPLRSISAKLLEEGHLSPSGKAYHLQSIVRMFPGG